MKSRLNSILTAISFCSAASVPVHSALLVSSFNSNEVLAFDIGTGAYSGAFISSGAGGLDGPAGHTVGPDGNFYLSSITNDRVLRYSPAGVSLGIFAIGGGLDGPAGITFGPDGNLYVVSESTGQILRYNGISGSFMNVFATIPGSDPRVPIDLAFGPDADLYVSTQLPTSAILRFSGITGAFLGTFASGSGLFFPTSFSFHNSLLYVNSLGNDSVMRFAAATGSFVDTFLQGTGLNETAGDNSGIAFNGNSTIFVSNGEADSISRFDAATGQFLSFISAPTLDDPTWISNYSIPEPTSTALFLWGAALFLRRRTLCPSEHNA